MPIPPDHVIAGFASDDRAVVAQWLGANPQCLDLNRPEGHEFSAWAMAAARRGAMLDQMQDQGLDVRAVSKLWAPGMGLESGKNRGLQA